MKEADRGKTSWSGLEDLLQRLRHWHATETYRGSWSGAQLHSNPVTAPCHRTDSLVKRDSQTYHTIFLIYFYVFILNINDQTMGEHKQKFER